MAAPSSNEPVTHAGVDVTNPAPGPTFPAAGDVWTADGAGRAGYTTLPTISLDACGGDPSGTTYSDAAIAAAFAIGAGAPFVIALGAGTYKFALGLPTFGIGQGIVGPGPRVCTLLTHQASGDFIRAYDPTFIADQSNFPDAGPFAGFTIDGANVTGAANGMHLGDLNGLRLTDLRVRNFAHAGSFGILMSNVNGWSEGNRFRAVDIRNCDTQIRFNGAGGGHTSFDYGAYDLWLIASAGQNGVLVDGGATLTGVDLKIRGNFETGAANGIARADTGYKPAALTVGNSGGDTANIVGHIDIGVEADGASTAHSTIAFNSSVATDLEGNLQWINGGVAFASPQGLYPGAAFSFTGRGDVDPANLQGVWGHSIAYNSSWLTAKGDAFWSGTTLDVAAATGVQFWAQLLNGAQAIHLADLTPNLPFDIDLFLNTPAAGTVPTVTWDASVNWGAAGAPTFLSDDNTTWIRLISSNGGTSVLAVVLAKGF